MRYIWQGGNKKYHILGLNVIILVHIPNDAFEIYQTFYTAKIKFLTNFLE